MSRVLYIQASPRGQRSHSIAVANAFIEAYRKKNPKDEIITLNLFEARLPPFEGLIIQAKYSLMHGQKYSAEEAIAWKAVEKVIEFFKAADKYVLAVPMWNYSIPYRLKEYIDILVQPSYTFAASEGLLKGRKAFVAYARGGDYSGDRARRNHQQPYLELMLGFMGITDVSSVAAEQMLAGAEVAAKKQQEAIALAVVAAKNF